MYTANFQKTPALPKWVFSVFSLCYLCVYTHGCFSRFDNLAPLTCRVCVAGYLDKKIK